MIFFSKILDRFLRVDFDGEFIPLDDDASDGNVTNVSEDRDAISSPLNPALVAFMNTLA